MRLSKLFIKIITKNDSSPLYGWQPVGYTKERSCIGVTAVSSINSSKKTENPDSWLPRLECPINFQAK